GMKRITGGDPSYFVFADKIEFRYPADVVNLAKGPGDGSCVRIDYAVKSGNPTRSLRTDVFVEIDPQGNNNWQRAKLGDGADGVKDLIAANAVGGHNHTSIQDPETR